jgi:hypothetical protein
MCVSIKFIPYFKNPDLSVDHSWLTDSSPSVSVKFPPNIVNIHVKHPPEASVQIHQVSRIDGPTGQKVKDSQAGQAQVSYQSLPVQKTQTVHSTYSHQQVVPHIYPVAAKTQLGRCFQETIGSQVSNVAQPILEMSSRYGIIP